MAVFELPNAVQLEGITLFKGVFAPVLTSGSLNDYKLNKDTDVVIATYPRTGTTWMTQIVSLLQAGEDKYGEVSKVSIDDRAVYMEMHNPLSPTPEIEKMKTLAPPRIAKTHLPFQFVNQWMERDQVKVIVVMRNPKDTLVSYYHFYKSVKSYGPFEGTWNDFFAHIQTGKQLYGDQIDWMESWWRNRQNENILFLKYEDLLQDLPSEMRRIIHFLDLDVTETTFNRVLQDASFGAMKQNPSTNYEQYKRIDQSVSKFIRSGQVGEWKKYFTVGQNEWFDEKYMKSMKQLGLDLQYE